MDYPERRQALLAAYQSLLLPARDSSRCAEACAIVRKALRNGDYYSRSAFLSVVDRLRTLVRECRWKASYVDLRKALRILEGGKL